MTALRTFEVGNTLAPFRFGSWSSVYVASDRFGHTRERFEVSDSTVML